MNTARLAAVLVVLSIATTTEALAAGTVAPTPITDGSVASLTQSGSRVFMTGSFRYAGPLTGSAVRLDPASGAPGLMPYIEGPVMAAIPDGSNGWYIGGAFNKIAGRAHGPLAHIRADGSVDPSFNPFPNGPVAALMLAGNRLYAGGYFSIIGGLSRNKLAALDPATGAVDPSFDANVGGGGAVTPSQAVRPIGSPQGYYYACGSSVASRPTVPNGDGVLTMLVSGNHLFIGGSFAGAGGAGRLNFAALDPATGRADPSAWQTNPDGPVYSMAVSDSRLYVGGDFQQLSGLSRSHLAAFDLATGNVDTNFQAAADGRVNALAVAPDRLYVGGGFGHIGGADAVRLAAVSLSTGAPVGAIPGANGDVASLVVNGSRVYVSGGFDQLGGVTRRFIGALSAATGALDSSFAPQLDDVPVAVAVAPSGLFLGGPFDSAGGAARPGLAAVDAATGALDRTFAPAFPRQSQTTTVAATSNRLYVTLTDGGFSPRRVLVAVDPVTGAIDPGFNAPALTGDPRSIVTDGARLYIEGATVAGRKIALIALDAATGKLDDRFRPKDHGNTIALKGNRLFVAGRFQYGKRRKTRYGTYYRTRSLAAMDKRTGRMLPFGTKLPWSRFASADQVVVSGNRVYVNSGLAYPNRRSRGLTAIDVRTARIVKGFKPSTRTFQILSAGATRLYVTGRFGAGGVAALRTSNGKVDSSFAPAIGGGGICDVQPAAGRVYLGGAFTSLEGRPQPNFGAITIP